MWQEIVLSSFIEAQRLIFQGNLPVNPTRTPGLRRLPPWPLVVQLSQEIWQCHFKAFDLAVLHLGIFPNQTKDVGRYVYVRMLVKIFRIHVKKLGMT